jgi:CDP-4-dehydro-6-deoxyglucose reductase, E3
LRQAEGDIALEVEDLGHLGLPAPRTLPCRIHSMLRPSDDVLCLQLRLPPHSGFTYRAGQYIDLIGPGGVRRSYSLANAHTPDGLLELHVRKVDGGALSRYWFEGAKVNDLLRLRGPLGTFVLREIAGRDLVFLATGTGIAPIKAMLESLRADAVEQPRSVAVLWGGRRPQDHYWQALPAEDLTLVLSRAGTDWTGARGHVQDVLLQRSTIDWASTEVYACGSEAMIHSAQARLAAEGLPRGRFHSDAFVCSASTGSIST